MNCFHLLGLQYNNSSKESLTCKVPKCWWSSNKNKNKSLTYVCISFWNLNENKTSSSSVILWCLSLRFKLHANCMRTPLHKANVLQFKFITLLDFLFLEVLFYKCKLYTTFFCVFTVWMIHGSDTKQFTPAFIWSAIWITRGQDWG